MDGVSDFKQFLNFGESVTLMHLSLKKKMDPNTAVCVNNVSFSTAAWVQMKHWQGEWRMNLTFHSWGLRLCRKIEGTSMGTTDSGVAYFFHAFLHWESLQSLSIHSTDAFICIFCPIWPKLTTSPSKSNSQYSKILDHNCLCPAS